MRFAFIDDNRHLWPVEMLCRVLEVSRSGFFAWRSRGPSERQVRREALAAKVQAVHAANRGVYGSPRVHAALVAQGERVCMNTVARVMHEQGVRARTQRRFRPRTTDSGHAQPVASNLLDRQFEAAAINHKWLVDITYIPTEEGWLYLAGVLDLCSRKIVGWSMADHLQADLAMQALSMAMTRRGMLPGAYPGTHPEVPGAGAGVLHHSDRGVQYACDDYQALLEAYGMQVSMSGKGDCWDNAPMESFWSTLKRELVHPARYATREEAKNSIFEYIEVFYNRRRLHSSIGYLSPEAFEASLT